MSHKSFIFFSSKGALMLRLLFSTGLRENSFYFIQLLYLRLCVKWELWNLHQTKIQHQNQIFKQPQKSSWKLVLLFQIFASMVCGQRIHFIYEIQYLHLKIAKWLARIMWYECLQFQPFNNCFNRNINTMSAICMYLLDKQNTLKLKYIFFTNLSHCHRSVKL